MRRSEDQKRVAEIIGYEERLMVYCKPVKTYVDIEFCLNGGPMQADGPCEYFRDLVRDKKTGQVVAVVDAVPTQQAVIRSIVKEA